MNVYKHIKDIQDIYKIPGGSLARPRGAGPGPRRLAAAWYFLYIALYLVYICIHIFFFDVFGITVASSFEPEPSNL